MGVGRTEAKPLERAREERRTDEVREQRRETKPVVAAEPVLKPVAARAKEAPRAIPDKPKVVEARVDTRKVETIAPAPYKPVDTTALQKKVLEGPIHKSELQADFVDIGMGPTGMMAMLAAVATGHTAVGVEIRGAPVRGVHQNIRIDWYHELAKIDAMMLERYGPDGIPKLPNGKPFILHDFFYNAQREGGHLDFPEIFGIGEEQNQNVAGRLTDIAFEDARDETKAANGGKAQVFVVPPPALPEKADPSKIKSDMKDVLDGPSTFQAALANYEAMLRAYIHAMEKQDRAAGRAPRVKTYENHRVAVESDLAAGYIDAPEGKRRIVIEEVVDKRGPDGVAKRVQREGSTRIDLGVPTRFALTAGFGGGADAKTLGYKQEDVVYHDPATNKDVVAQQNWIVGEVTANVGGKLIRRISTITNPKTGEKETVRQIAVGHERAPNVAWVPVQVPDFMTFDPIEAGLLPKETSPNSAEYREAAQKMVFDFYVQQVAAVTHIPEADIRKMRMFFGPSFFTLKERIGASARVATNGNVAGDLMGNGHFLTSGGSMTGMIGHGGRFISYWEALNRGVAEQEAAKELEDGIKTDSEAWLHVSIKEFLDVSPVNFGADRAKAIGIKGNDGPAHTPHGPSFGLGNVLGQGNWAKAFQRLRRGDFGQAGVDFYVPKEEADITKAPDVTVQVIK